VEYTNKHALPEEIISALTKNRYVGDDEEQDLRTDFSVSQLVSPTQQTILRKRYPDCENPDVIDRVWVLFGHIAHALLEEHGSDDSITEKRFYKNVFGKTISGQVDHYKARRVTDYKTTGAYKIKKGDFDDWQMQLNLYSLLCEEAGYPVDSIRIIAILRDWSKAEFAKDPQNYPKAPIVELYLVKWSKEVRERVLNNRVRLLLANEDAPDDKLPECSKKERWMSFRGWYALAEGNSVGRWFKTEEEAINFGANHKRSVEISKRYTPPTRCFEYCNVNSKCHQFKKYQERQNGEIKE
jgi:hypothetical protein